MRGQGPRVEWLFRALDESNFVEHVRVLTMIRELTENGENGSLGVGFFVLLDHLRRDVVGIAKRSITARFGVGTSPAAASPCPVRIVGAGAVSGIGAQ